MEHIHALVTFSLDVNAIQLDKNPFKNWYKQRKQTRWNKRHFKPLLHKMLESCGIDGMTLTKGTGLYRSDSGQVYEEESYTIDLVFTKGPSVDKLARTICHTFYQESVLVREVEYTNVQLIPRSNEQDEE